MKDVLFALITLSAWALFWWTDQLNPWRFGQLCFWASFYGTLSIWQAAYGDMPLTSASDMAFAAWCAYHAWKRRKPRKRKPLGVLTRVRDLGHRLVTAS